eukprot:CAMPEP_0174245694 /NCGR_PEP_ID=MMETSP0417-20130205/40299_1 /TAXON_ID=242541 /ORGANISM="Mayorella sp, Strain BSH-02190019" /LENGTH=377 /DNA_ID=CAMNT_0015325505 /DNA_START=33 /DNA_END=1166 /DNA_ORIENTATION=-
MEAESEAGEDSSRRDTDAENLWRYALVFALLVVAVTWLLCDAVIHENRFQLLCYLLSLILLLVLLSYEYFQARFADGSASDSAAADNDAGPGLLLTVTFAAAWVCVPLDVLLVVLVWRRCGWLAVEKAGATAAALKRYTRLQQHDSLLKLDLLLCVVGVFLLALFFVHNYELYIAAAVVLFQVGWAWLGHWVVRRKQGPVLAAELLFYAFALVMPAYVVTKAVLAFTGHYRYNQVWLGPIVFEVVCLLVIRVLLMVLTGFLLWAVRRIHRELELPRHTVQESTVDSLPQEPLVTAHLYDESSDLLSAPGAAPFPSYSSGARHSGGFPFASMPADAPLDDETLSSPDVVARRPLVKTLGETADSSLWDSRNDLAITRF